MFCEHPCVKMKKGKQVGKKHITFYMTHCKKEQFCFEFVVAFALWASETQKATGGPETGDRRR